MNVAFAMTTEELARFDAWRTTQLPRGAALMQLLDLAETKGLQPQLPKAKK